MQKPYYEVMAECRNEQCELTIFTEERQRNDNPGALAALVCPRCGQRATVNEVQKIQ